jgi:2-succinyl-5-enolpyruvyl-6-hydroxy-3-cyclohexene-1-carboxylate synthase
MNIANRNLAWADAIIAGLVAEGVRHAVISPGSRSTPLVLAAARRSELTTHVLLDERSAAFFALGLAKESDEPVAVIATSGSAPANWFPAVIEASWAGVPLILLSADRPPEWIGSAANQTIDQNRLFGAQVRAFHAFPPPDESINDLHGVLVRLIDLARWPIPGPIHLNLPFREPLVPEFLPEPPPLPRAVCPARPRLSVDITDLARLLSSGPGVIVCGARDEGEEFSSLVRELAVKLFAPILADPLSNLRFAPGESVFSRADAFLRNLDFVKDHRLDWVLNFGGPPISKNLLSFMDQVLPGGLIMVDGRGDWPDALLRVDMRIHADPAWLVTALLGKDIPPASFAWLADFRQAENAAKPEISSLPAEGLIISEIISRLPENGMLFCGNSMPVRDLDSFSGTGEKRLSFVANRGASGIDGNISTFLGQVRARGGKAVALIGDLAFQHDLNGLAAAKGLDAVIIVFANGGGGIFEYLPQSGLAEFERYWLTPGDLDIGAAAKAYGLAHAQISVINDFSAQLQSALAAKGVSILEVVIDRKESVARHRAYWQKISDGDL